MDGVSDDHCRRVLYECHRSETDKWLKGKPETCPDVASTLIFFNWWLGSGSPKTDAGLDSSPAKDELLSGRLAVIEETRISTPPHFNHLELQVSLGPGASEASTGYFTFDSLVGSVHST